MSRRVPKYEREGRRTIAPLSDGRLGVCPYCGKQHPPEGARGYEMTSAEFGGEKRCHFAPHDLRTERTE